MHVGWHAGLAIGHPVWQGAQWACCAHGHQKHAPLLVEMLPAAAAAGAGAVGACPKHCAAPPAAAAAAAAAGGSAARPQAAPARAERQIGTAVALPLGPRTLTAAQPRSLVLSQAWQRPGLCASNGQEEQQKQQQRYKEPPSRHAHPLRLQVACLAMRRHCPRHARE
eukprot:scaffold53831_cov18-Tisochrysis_lutea.AAC.1